MSGPVERVSATSIFARVDDGKQTRAYSMRPGIRLDVATLRPVPVPPSSPREALEFIDLEDYPELYTDLSNAFPGRLQLGVAGGHVEPLKVDLGA